MTTTEIETVIHGALSAALSQTEHHPVMLNRWCVTLEVISDRGEPQLWTLRSQSLAQWDALGMLTFHARTLQPSGDDD